MGRPKFSRKKYESPSHPWQADRIKAENELRKKYGLKNKREIWKAQTVLRRYRGHARELLAKISSGAPQTKKESEQLLTHLTRMNILPLNSTLDDVLALETEPVLSRRLQTLTYLKGLANTPKQARQLIIHGHIAIAGRKTTIPGYMVTKDEESKIGYAANSPLNDVLHPARPSSEFKSIPTKKEIKPEEQKGEKQERKEGHKKVDNGKKKVEEKKPSEKSVKGSSDSNEKHSEKKEKTGDSEKHIKKPVNSKERKIEEKNKIKDKSDDVKNGGR